MEGESSSGKRRLPATNAPSPKRRRMGDGTTYFVGKRFYRLIRTRNEQTSIQKHVDSLLDLRHGEREVAGNLFELLGGVEPISGSHKEWRRLLSFIGTTVSIRDTNKVKTLYGASRPSTRISTRYVDDNRLLMYLQPLANALERPNLQILPSDLARFVSNRFLGLRRVNRQIEILTCNGEWQKLSEWWKGISRQRLSPDFLSNVYQCLSTHATVVDEEVIDHVRVVHNRAKELCQRAIPKLNIDALLKLVLEHKEYFQHLRRMKEIGVSVPNGFYWLLFDQSTSWPVEQPAVRQAITGDLGIQILNALGDGTEISEEDREAIQSQLTELEQQATSSSSTSSSGGGGGSNQTNDTSVEEDTENELASMEERVSQIMLPEAPDPTSEEGLDELLPGGLSGGAMGNDPAFLRFVEMLTLNYTWLAVLRDEQGALQRLRGDRPTSYSSTVLQKFEAEFQEVQHYVQQLNDNHLPRWKKEVIVPNRMQCLIAHRVSSNSVIGNWCGTGAGKTVSAIFSSIVIESKFTVIICPNVVASQWCHEIRRCCHVPNQNVVRDVNRGLPLVNWDEPVFLVVNYEYFHRNHRQRVERILQQDHAVGMIVFDEAQRVKADRTSRDSRSNNMVDALRFFVSQARNKQEVKVLLLSATPVVNQTGEGWNILEVGTAGLRGALPSPDQRLECVVRSGRRLSSNDMRACLQLWQQMVVLPGFRWRKRLNVNFEKRIEYVDITDEQFQQCLSDVPGVRNSRAGLQRILIGLKLNTIIQLIHRHGDKAIIYTRFKTNDIKQVLGHACSQANLQVGFITGDEQEDQREEALRRFTGRGRRPNETPLNVLIGTDCLSTGLDGMQDTCSTVIFASLPDTYALEEQINGRVYRQGQTQDVYSYKIDVRVRMGDTSRSRDFYDNQRIQLKSDMMSAVIDGIVPDRFARDNSEEEVLSGFNKWVERMKSQLLEEQDSAHSPDIDLMDTGESSTSTSITAQWHRRYHSMSSNNMNAHFQQHHDEWIQYHEEVFNTLKENWDSIPTQQIASYIYGLSADMDANRSIRIIDMGCGTGDLYRSLRELFGEHERHRFQMVSVDHIAYDPNGQRQEHGEILVAANMANLETLLHHEQVRPSSFDHVVHCLSLRWGRSREDASAYLRAGHTLLSKFGSLWICDNCGVDSSKRERLVREVEKVGFVLQHHSVEGRLVYFRFVKKLVKSGFVAKSVPAIDEDINLGE